MARDGQTTQSSGQRKDSGFQKMYFEVNTDKPDVTKTEIAGNVTELAVQAAGQIAGFSTGGSSPFGGMGEGAMRDVKNLYHEKGMKKHLEIHLRQYEKAGYLMKREATSDGKSTIWTTTPQFHEAKFLFLIYKDIEQYVQHEGITFAELGKLGNGANIELHRKDSKVDFRDPITHLYRCCKATGVRNVTTSDIAALYDELPFAKIAKAVVKNALRAEEKQRKDATAAKASKPPISPMLGRVLVLAAMCGIRSLQLSDISILLAKAGLFETVMRSRIAHLRNQHATQVINMRLFSGKTESHGTTFIEADSQAYTVVGKMEKEDKAVFNEPWKSCNCELVLPKKTKYTAGAPISMPTAWARLLSQRDSTKSAKKLDTLHFLVSTNNNNNLIAQPSGRDWFFLSSAPYERHYGGIVGPSSCICRSEAKKIELPNTWKYGDKLIVRNPKRLRLRDVAGVSGFLRHAQRVSKNEITLLDYRGDWPMGVFLMQALPQSSYVQGKGECLKCAVKNAALAGCLQVIACNTGPVSSEKAK